MRHTSVWMTNPGLPTRRDVTVVIYASRLPLRSEQGVTLPSSLSRRTLCDWVRGGTVLPTDAVWAIAQSFSSLLGCEWLEEGVAECVGHADAVGGVVLEHALNQIEQRPMVGFVHCHVALKTHDNTANCRSVYWVLKIELNWIELADCQSTHNLNTFQFNTLPCYAEQKRQLWERCAVREGLVLPNNMLNIFSFKFSIMVALKNMTCQRLFIWNTSKYRSKKGS